MSIDPTNPPVLTDPPTPSTPAPADPAGPRDPAVPGDPATSAPAPADDSFTIKVDGVERTVTRDELIALAQKSEAADARMQEAANAIALREKLRSGLVDGKVSDLKDVYAQFFDRSVVDDYFEKTMNPEPQDTTDAPADPTAEAAAARIKALEDRLEAQEALTVSDIKTRARSIIANLLDKDDEFRRILASLPEDNRKGARDVWEEQVYKGFENLAYLKTAKGEHPTLLWADSLPGQAMEDFKKILAQAGPLSPTHIGRAGESSFQKIAHSDSAPKPPDPREKDFPSLFEDFANERMLQAVDKINQAAARDKRPLL